MDLIIKRLEEINDKITNEELAILQGLEELFEVEKMIKEKLKQKAEMKDIITRKRKWTEEYEKAKKSGEKFTKDYMNAKIKEELSEITGKLDDEIRQLEEEQKRKELEIRKHRIERDRGLRLFGILEMMLSHDLHNEN